MIVPRLNDADVANLRDKQSGDRPLPPRGPRMPVPRPTGAIDLVKNRFEAAPLPTGSKRPWRACLAVPFWLYQRARSNRPANLFAMFRPNGATTTITFLSPEGVAGVLAKTHPASLRCPVMPPLIGTRSHVALMLGHGGQDMKGEAFGVGLSHATNSTPDPSSPRDEVFAPGKRGGIGGVTISFQGNSGKNGRKLYENRIGPAYSRGRRSAAGMLVVPSVILKNHSGLPDPIA